MKFLKIIVVIAVAVAVVVLAQRRFGHVQLPQRQMMGGPSVVAVEQVKVRPFADRVEAIGTAAANESVTITANVSEKVDKILFDSGDEVKRGALLVQLQDGEEQADVREAETTAVEHLREYERCRQLWNKKAISEKDFDTQRSTLEEAKAKLQAAQARLRDRAISAPFTGALGIRRVSSGALVNPGDVITTLDDLDTIKTEFTVPETLLGELKVGMSVEAVSAAWPDEKFSGKVSSVDSRVDSTTRAVSAQALIANPKRRLRGGMLLTIELIGRRREAVAVPEKALLAFAEKHYIFALQPDQKVQRREVKLGRRDTGWVEILDGLKPGDTIVVEGVMDLKDGADVTVAGAPKPPATKR